MSDYLKKRQELIFAGRPLKTKEKKPIAPKSAKRIQKEKEQKLQGGDDALDLWFEARRKEMTGKCLFCGGKTEAKNDETYRSSIAHLLPKKDNFGGVPSVATHEDNWIELCFYGNSCHTNFDNKMITWEFLYDSYEWKVMMEKMKKILPFIHPDELKNVPEQFLKANNHE